MGLEIGTSIAPEGDELDNHIVVAGDKRVEFRTGQRRYGRAGVPLASSFILPLQAVKPTVTDDLGIIEDCPIVALEQTRRAEGRGCWLRNI